MTGRAHLTIHGPLTRAGLPDLTDRCCAFFATNAGAVVDCDVTGVGADAVTVDALSRLHLVAQRNNCTVVFHHASAELSELVDLMGLADVLRVDPI